MARYTIDIDDELEMKLSKYMKDSNIKLRSKAIKSCILIATDKESDKDYIYSVDKKLNTILYRLSIYKKILEQLFVNMEFSENNDIPNDVLLKQLYEEYGKKHFGRLSGE